MTDFADHLLNEKQLAIWLGISLPTLQRQRSDCSGPPFVQLSKRRVGYRRCDVERWLETRTITHPDFVRNTAEVSESESEGAVTAKVKPCVGFSAARSSQATDPVHRSVRSHRSLRKPPPRIHAGGGRE
jgi:predicted DNA-binding transcriptional regulator AlpA